MKLWRALTGHPPVSRLPFSWKALIYAALCTFFGTACFYCGMSVFGMEGGIFGDPAGKYPYELPAMSIALLVAEVLLLFCGTVWIFTVAQAPRKWLNILIAVVLALVGFCLLLPVMNLIRDLCEQIGQLILYGRTHNHDLV